MSTQFIFLEQWIANNAFAVFFLLLFLFVAFVTFVLLFRRTKQELSALSVKHKQLEDNSQQAEQHFHSEVALYQEQLEQQTEYKNNLEGQLEALKQGQTQLTQLTNDYAQLKVTYGQLKTQSSLEKEFHQERLEQARKTQDQLQNTFEQLSSKVFKAQQQDFSQVAQAQLQPIKQQMEQFKGKMEELNRLDTQERAKLFAELDHLKSANQKISEEAVNLTNALRSNSKKRGLWGEAVLERVLEASGLRKGEEYKTQVSFERQGKRFLPDVLVMLPDGKQVIIDAKVVLLDYERYVNADDEVTQNAALKQYADSIKAQVKSLSDKKYHQVNERACELVLLFVPLEGAFQTLLETNAQVFQNAMSQSIVITSPTTLMATLRIIHLLWQNERQQKNAFEIAELAGKLYDQMALMIASFNDVGDKLDKAQSAYQKTINQLSEGRGNVLRKAEQLKVLGAKSKKTIALSSKPEGNLSEDVLPE